MQRKGIATETIFYLVIGIAVVALLVALVISYTSTSKKEGACNSAYSEFCRRWSESNYQAYTSACTGAGAPVACCTGAGAPAGGCGFDTTSQWASAKAISGNNCQEATAPTQQICEVKGYKSV